MTLPFLDSSLDLGMLLFLLVSLAIALGFEFVNGFHDTANAVATVIYTRSLSPRKAVLWSGLCNFVGVYLGGIAVAYSIVYLLPVDLLIAIGSGEGMAMVLALLVAAILWNLGTWYLALPASSSHTLIGAILGVGLASSVLPGRSFGDGVNWHKAGEVGLSLLVSPLVGFGLAAGLLCVLKRVARDPGLHKPPVGDQPPPWWVRGVLMLTCTGVSVAHGSNDGQKGVGLIMLILIGILPAHFALNLDYRSEQIGQTVQAAADLDALLRRSKGGAAPSREGKAPADADLSALHTSLADVRATLEGKASLRDVSSEARWRVRTEILQLNHTLARMEVEHRPALSAAEWVQVRQLRAQLRGATDYAPTWVLAAVACALGVGTTVGWKRIVVTVGEKIGKTHMTYAQGASAEIVAMSAIGLADVYGLPVSTTHVLSSGIAGTMAANRSGLQWATVEKIVLAWVLTLPAAMLLAGGLFLLFRLFVS
jgi:PiT family inorganic phosphate transporter